LAENSQGREASRFTIPTADQVRIGDQPEDRKGLNIPNTLIGRADEVIE
jgi:hypothetical protein